MSKSIIYKDLVVKLIALIGDEKDYIANLANTSALLFEHLEDINWVGFYLFKDKELVLGPFQGKSACIRIKLNQGVCGYCAMNRKSVVVEDVHHFKGHIACDSASKSEIVIPIINQGRLIGVLDIDSPKKSRFDNIDKEYLEEIVQILISKTKF